MCQLECAAYAVVPLEEDRAAIELCTEMLKTRGGMKIIAVEAAAIITALCWLSDGQVRGAYMELSRETIVKALANSVA